MKGFPGVATYQEYCRKAVMRDGYILMCPQTGHRCHIDNLEELMSIHKKMQDPEFWNYYNDMRREAPNCETVKQVKEYYSTKAQLEKNSINYRIQNRGACCFKLSAIKLFNWILKNKYQNIVKLCVPVHDEFNLECPENMAEEVADVLVKCMVSGGKPFCNKVYLGADVGIYDHWVH